MYGLFELIPVTGAENLRHHDTRSHRHSAEKAHEAGNEQAASSYCGGLRLSHVVADEYKINGVIQLLHKAA